LIGEAIALARCASPRIPGDLTGTPWRQTMTKAFFLLSVFFCVEGSSRRIDSALLCRGEAARI
jgi:hypothetical protein